MNRADVSLACVLTAIYTSILEEVRRSWPSVKTDTWARICMISNFIAVYNPIGEVFSAYQIHARGIAIMFGAFRGRVDL